MTIFMLGLGRYKMDENAIIILINMSGWVIVGYLTRQYFSEMKNLKKKTESAITMVYDLKNESMVMDLRIKNLYQSITDLKTSVEKIVTTMEHNNEKLIDELKKELRERR